MKTKWFTLLFGIFAWCRAADGEPNFAFIGVMIADGTTRVVLVDRATASSSGWMAVGESFHNFAVSAYDAVQEAVILRKGKATFVVPLAVATTTPSDGTVLVLGNHAFNLSADRMIREDGHLIFRGNVMGQSGDSHLSSDEAIIDSAAGTLILRGNAKVQIGGATSTGDRIMLYLKKR